MTPLQSYRELTFRMAGDLVALADIARRRGQHGLADEADDLRRRIEARRFSLAVVGEFKRGKSTLVNALLGAPVLPADVLPASATLNRVTFGLSPGATLWFHDGRPPEVVPVESLADHVTKLTHESAARAATVREAVITHPLALCRNDVDLVDTPGLADEPAMTDVTVGVLPAIDAAIVVTMADSPFSDGEAALVRRLRERGVDNLLFVVTAIDRIRRDSDRERVLAAVRDRVQAAGIEAPAVWAVSGQDALDGRVEGDADKVSRSGLPAFEAGLEQFLTRSDGVALARRAAQLAALCSALLSPAPANADRSSDAAPLHALLDAADRGLQRQVRRWEAAGTAAWDAVRSELEALPKDVGQVAGAVVAKHRGKVVPGWQERRDALMGELASEVDAAVRERIVAAVASAGAALGRVAADEQPELDRAWTALGEVLPFVAAAVGKPAPSPAAPLPVDDSPPSPDEWAELHPGAAAIADAAARPELVQLGRGSEKLDFLSKTMAGYNLPGQFAKIVIGGLSARFATHWEERPVRGWFQRWWSARGMGVLGAIDAARGAIRSLQRDVDAWAEREVVLREREAHERAFEAGRLEEFRQRADEVLAELRRTGFTS